MAFTNPNFPGQKFNTVDELREAERLRKEVELKISTLGDKRVTKVTATIIPAPKFELERMMLLFEQRLARLESREDTSKEKKDSTNKDSLPIGMTLKGSSKGTLHTLEVLDEGYLCSTGEISATLSAAALEVSGNRRSGWKFWTDDEGTPIGEITGRLKKNERVTDPFENLKVSRM